MSLNTDTSYAKLARCIKCVLRDFDTVSRLGGDEFTVILPKPHDLAQSRRAAEQILERLAQAVYFVNHQAGQHISASISIALYPQDASEMTALFKCVDKAMYIAQDQGRKLLYLLFK